MGNNGMSPEQAHADQLQLAYRAMDAAHASSPEQLAQLQAADDASKLRAEQVRRAQEFERRRLANEKAELARRQEERAAAETEQARIRALDAWLLAGGTPGGFAEQWPSIRREQLRQAALGGETALGRRIAEKMAEDSMYAEF